MSVLRKVLVAAPTGRLHPDLPMKASVVCREACVEKSNFKVMREYKVSVTFETNFVGGEFDEQFGKAQDYIIHHVFGEFYPMLIELRHALNNLDVAEATRLTDKIQKQMFIE